MNIFTKSIFLISSGFLYWRSRFSYLLFTFGYKKILTVSCFFCLDGEMLMFEEGIVIFLFGLLLYSTREESRLAFCFLVGWGVIFFSKSSLDSLISSFVLLFFSDSFSLFIFCYSFSCLLVKILNSFSILSILAMSIKAIFFCLLIFYNLRFLLPESIGFWTFIRSLIKGNFIYGECFLWRGFFIFGISIWRLKLYNFSIFLFCILF